MPGPEDLDRRLRAALGDGAPPPRPGPEATRALRSGLARRRAGRRRTGALAALAVAALAVVVSVTTVVSRSGTEQTGAPSAAAPPVHHPASAPARHPAPASESTNGVAGLPQAASGAVPAPCVLVGVGAGPSRCSGAVVPGTAVPGAALSNPPTFAQATATPGVVVGQVLTVSFPASPGVVWSGVRVAEQTPSPSAGGPVLAVAPGGAGAASTARVTAEHPGTAVVEATGSPRCGPGTGACPAPSTWVLTVTVVGR